MIEKISGTLESKANSFLVVMVGGMGLKINISQNFKESLPALGSEINLLTYLHVKEDILDLYGFKDENERIIFLLLISISGIGPKLALTILSGLESIKLKEKIVASDVEALTKIQGVGAKTAKRIIVELKEKLVKSNDISLGFNEKGKHSQLYSDVFNALISLGYKPNYAKSACDKLQKNGEFEGDLEQVIKKALKEIGN